MHGAYSVKKMYINLASGFLYSLTDHLANDEWKITDGVTETKSF